MKSNTDSVARDILLVGEFENLFTELVEGAKHRALVGSKTRLDIFEQRVVDHEGDFTRIVIPPETHAMSGGIVATAGVGKIKHRDQLFSYTAE